MRSGLLLLAVALALAVQPACRREPPPPPPPPPAAPSPPPSVWQEADARSVAEQFAAAAVAQPWCAAWQERLARTPLIAIGAIEDRSGERVDTAGFVAALRQALAAQDGARLAPAREDGAADLTVGGAVSAQRGTLEGRAVVFFAIDLQVRDREQGEVVWHFAVERPVPLP